MKPLNQKPFDLQKLSALLEEARSIQDGDPVVSMIGNLYFTRPLFSEEIILLSEYLEQKADLLAPSPHQFFVMQSAHCQE